MCFSHAGAPHGARPSRGEPNAAGVCFAPTLSRVLLSSLVLSREQLYSSASALSSFDTPSDSPVATPCNRRLSLPLKRKEGRGGERERAGMLRREQEEERADLTDIEVGHELTGPHLARAGAGQDGQDAGTQGPLRDSEASGKRPEISYESHNSALSILSNSLEHRGSFRSGTRT